MDEWFDPVGVFPAIVIAASRNDVPGIEALLRAGCNVDSLTIDGSTPLVLAVRTGSVHAATVLLENGADPNIATAKGEFALQIAAQQMDSALVSLLLRYGASVHMRNSEGVTAIVCAAQRGTVDCVRVLLDNGADLTDRGMSGWTAVGLASYAGRLDVIEFVLRRGIRSEWEGALVCATCGHQTSVVEALLRAGVCADDTDRFGTTPLYCAATQGYTDLAELLLEHGADPNRHDRAALYTAACNKNRRLVGALIRAGASTRGLVERCIVRHLREGVACDDAVLLLLEHGADLPEPELVGRWDSATGPWSRGEHPLQVASATLEAEMARHLGDYVPHVVRLASEFVRMQ